MIEIVSTLQTPKAKGNSIIEYSLIGVLVVSVAIVAMFVFGKNFKEHLANMDTDMKGNVSKASFIEAQAQAAASMAAISIGPGTNALNSDSATQDGLAQTTGANGDQLNTGIQGSKEDADATQKEPPTPEEQLKALLADLSNEAHKIAYLQSLIENISKYANGDNSKLQSTMIYYNGMVVNAYQLSYALSNGGEIISLDNKKQQVMESTAATTEVKEAIAQLADKIKDSALSTSSLTQDALYGDSTSGTTAISTRSDETHLDASKICTAGNTEDKKEGGFLSLFSGNMDTGTQCGTN